MDSVQIKENKYDRLIVFLILFLAFGSVGGAFQPVRLFIVGLIPLCTITFSKDDDLLKKYNYERYYFIFWILYGFVSTMWVFHLDESMKELVYLIVNFYGFFSILSLSSRANKPQKSIIKGWMLLFVVTLPIALTELWFDQHLNISYDTSDSYTNFGRGVVTQRIFASVTYGNLNGYNTILTYILPFLLSTLIRDEIKSNKWMTAIYWILSLFLIYIVFSNSSRAAIACVLIAFIVFMFYYLRNIKAFILFLSIFIAVASTLYVKFEELFYFLMLKMEVQGLEDEGRQSLIINGFDALIKSNLFGIGAADFMPTMAREYDMINTSPHNLFLEIIVQYGLVIGLLFLGMIGKIVWRIRKITSKRYKFIIISSLITFPMVTLIDSSYLLGVGTWLYIASLYVIGDVYFSKTSQ